MKGGYNKHCQNMNITRYLLSHILAHEVRPSDFFHIFSSASYTVEKPLKFLNQTSRKSVSSDLDAVRFCAPLSRTDSDMFFFHSVLPHRERIFSVHSDQRREIIQSY